MILNRRNWILLMTLMICAMVLSACSFRPEGTAVENTPVGQNIAPPEHSVVPTTEAPKAGTTTYTVTYMDGETLLATETVAEGGFPQALTETTANGGSIIGWRKGSDKTVLNAAAVAVLGDVTYNAVVGPELNRNEAFLAPETDGLFHPDQEFTRSDAVRAVYALLKNKPQGETFLNDVTTRARCYQAATTLATEGWVTLDNGRFHPDVAISLNDLCSLLGHVFSQRALESATANLGETLTRAQAAELFYTLLNAPQTGNSAFYPDVIPSDSYYAAVSALGQSGGVNWGEGGKPAAGFIHLEGYLYNVGNDGYFLKNSSVGSLNFGPDGRYTSGNIDLDNYVAGILVDTIHDGMTQDQKLRAVYDHVRDRYLYLKRNLYEVGELGWEIDEAITMFSTGKGNCYNFTAIFWALTRGIGYEAECLSGLVGVGRDPHSWVEIPIDGTLYIFDPETEMSYRLQDAYWADLYMLTYEEGEYWSYAREPYADELPAGEVTE